MSYASEQRNRLVSPERRREIARNAGFAGGNGRPGKPKQRITPEGRAVKLANLAKGRAVQAALRANPSVTTLRPAPSIPVSPAIALYREERDRRTARVNALIEDAKAMYARLYGASVGAAGERECR